ncbi:MAG: aldo/keto reductase [Methylococcaceae bacterium]|nr:aldo/keto reductase [Methylococcaceae bacterium]
MSTLTRLVLGSVALGLPYGIASHGETRQVAADAEVKAVIDHALGAGISVFDTAPSYGMAEQRLGQLLPPRGIAVWSKLSNLPTDGDLGERAKRSLAESLARLNRDHVDCLQWHNWTAQLAASRQFLAVWESLRDDPRVGHLGASTYGVEDALTAVRSGLFDQIQIEWNLLNQSVLDAVAGEAADRGVQLALRSVFLQGVLTAKGESLPPALAGLAAPRRRAKRMAVAWGLSLNALALRAALDHPARPLVLIGPDRQSQLREILDHAGLPPLPTNAFEELRGLDLAGAPETDPRTWRF